MPPLLRTGCDPAGQDGGLPDSVRRRSSGRSPVRTESCRNPTDPERETGSFGFDPDGHAGFGRRTFRPFPAESTIYPALSPSNPESSSKPMPNLPAAYAVKSLIFHSMCYSNHHHRFRDKAIQQFDRFSTRRATCAAVTTGSGTTLHTASGEFPTRATSARCART